jgi:hypothetical protein
MRLDGRVDGVSAVTSLRWNRIEVRAEHPNGEPYVREEDNRRKGASSIQHSPGPAPMRALDAARLFGGKCY